MFLNVHERVSAKTGKVLVTVALCDSDLIGRRLIEGDAALDLQLYASFYQGDLVDEKTAGETLVANLKGVVGPGGREPASYNIVGKKSVAVARKHLNVNEKSVKTIQGVPHVHVYRV